LHPGCASATGPSRRRTGSACASGFAGRRGNRIAVFL